MSPRVAVTGVGGAAGIAVMRSLADTDVQVVAIDADPAAAGLFLVPPSARAVAPLGADPGFVEWMLELCVARRIDVLVPTVDAELIALAAARHRFRWAGVRILAEPVGVLERCLDKWALHLALAGCAPLPRTEVIDADFDVAGWDLPFIVKPRTASGSRGVRLVERASDLAGVPLDGRLIAQELLPGAEYSVDVLGDGAGGVLAAVPRERMRIDSGIAVAARTVRDPELIEVATAVAEALGVEFVANVQLRRDVDGRPRLLEVNPRIPGTVALTVAAGIDMPRVAIWRLLERESAPVGDFAEVGMVRMLADLVVPAADLRGLAHVGADAAAVAR